MVLVSRVFFSSSLVAWDGPHHLSAAVPMPSIRLFSVKMFLTLRRPENKSILDFQSVLSLFPFPRGYHNGHPQYNLKMEKTYEKHISIVTKYAQYPCFCVGNHYLSLIQMLLPHHANTTISYILIYMLSDGL